MNGPEPAGPADFEEPDSRLVDLVLPSPNHGERRATGKPNCIVLHYTGMGDGPSAIAWLRNPASQVSCHYVVEEDGRVLQLVAEARRAWHAGRSSWAGETDLNDVSIGIEVVNAGHPGGLPPYPDPQVEAVVALCRDLVERSPIPSARVLAHSDVAPGRKIDPGEMFPWRRLFEAGVGLWVPPHPDRDGPVLETGQAGPRVADLKADLRACGYGIDVTGEFDPATAAVVRSFQLRFRPARVDGRADQATLATLADLRALLARSA